MQTTLKKQTGVVEPESEFQTERVVTIAAGHFLHDTFSAFISAILPLLRARFSLAYQAAFLLPVFAQLPTLLNPFIGYIADRVSVRYFIIFAPAVTATLMSLMGLAPSYAVLAIILFATGISIAAFHAPAGAMIASVAGDRVGRGMSIYMAAGELGRALGPLLIAFGVARFSLEGVWRLAFLGWAASGVLFWRLHNVEATTRPSDGRTFAEIRPKVISVFGVLSWFILTRNLMVAAVTVSLTTFMIDVVDAPFALAAVSLSILEGAGVVGALVSGTASDKFGRKTVLAVLFITAPIFLLGFLYVPSFLTIPCLIALGLTAITHTPVYLAYVQDNFPDNRALANGIFIAISFLIRAISVYLLGLFGDLFGLQTAYLIAVCVAFCAVLGLPFLRDGKHNSTH